MIRNNHKESIHELIKNTLPTVAETREGVENRKSSRLVKLMGQFF